MADGKVVIDTELDQSGISKGMSQVESKAGKIFGGIGKAGIGAMKGVAVGIGAVSTAIGGLATSAVKYNASMEQYATSFEVMTGSAEKSAEVMERLKKIGAETPYEFEDLAGATQRLMAFGMSADEAIDSFGMLGDIAQGDAQKLNSFSLALGKMESSQKVSLEYLNLMIENGFNPLNIVAEKTGESMSDLYKRVSAGGVSVEEIKDAMVVATSKGGQFFGSMDKQSKTLSGRLSTLSDNFKQLTGSIFGSTTTGAGELVSLASGWIEQLQVAFDEGGTEALLETIGNILADIVSRASEFAPKLLELATSLIESFLIGISENTETIVNGAIQIVSSLATAFLQLAPMLLQVGMQMLTELMNGMSANPDAMIEQVIAFVETMVTVFTENAPMLIEAGLNLILALGIGLIEALPYLVEKIPEIIQAICGTLIDAIPKIIETGILLLGSLVGNLPAIIVEIVSAVPKIISAFVDKFKSFKTTMKEIGMNLIKGIGEGISNAKDWLVGKIQELCSNATEHIKNFFGIHSPSTLMRDEVGRFIAEGIWVGFEQNDPMKQIQADLKNGVGAIQSSIRFENNQIAEKQLAGITQYITIEKEVESPDEMARAIRLESKYGLMRGAYA